MRDAQATRARLLAAASQEFTDHGIAGARVDRIAHNAEASKALLYNYFGNKDELFDAVFDAHVLANLDRVPLTAHDLSGYVVRLYDAYLDDPALVRLVTWKRLERTPTGNLFGPLGRHDVANLAAIAEAQAAGVVVDDVEPGGIWAMLIALAATWAQASIVHTADTREPRADHQRRRRALDRTVRRAFCVSAAD